MSLPTNLLEKTIFATKQTDPAHTKELLRVLIQKVAEGANVSASGDFCSFTLNVDK